LRLDFHSSFARSRESIHWPLLLSLFLLALLTSSALFIPKVNAFASGQNASVVIGQPSFNTNYRGGHASQSNLSSPWDVAFDSSGNLWVADSSNSRVLEFKAPFSNGESAAIVIGESSFTISGFIGGPPNGTVIFSPQGLAFDSSGNLWVSDSGDNRIVEFKAPFSNGQNASLVLGAPDLKTEENPGLQGTQTTLNAPAGITFDSSGNLWTADESNYRVLEFKAPFSSGEAASVVLGQDNFTARTFPNEPNCPPACNTPTKATLNDPSDVAFDSAGNLWVADRSDSRVVEFSPPFSNGQSASVVLGGECAIFGVVLAANCFDVTDGIAIDHSGTLWVSDSSNGRILGFPAPISNGENATVVLGEPDFVTGLSSGILNATQSNLANPEGIALDSSGNLWVADDGLNRVLEFSASIVSSTTTVSPTTPSSTTTSSGSTVVSIPQSSSASSSQSSSQSSQSSPSGAVPEFPLQVAGVAMVVVVTLASYLLLRRRPGDRIGSLPGPA